MKFARLAEYFERIEATTKRLEMFDIVAELINEASNEDIDRIVYFCQEQLKPPFYDIDFGLSEKYLLRAIADAAGSSTSEVEELYNELGDLGLLAERLVRREGGLSVAKVYDELTSIAETSGKGSTTTKIELVANLLKGLSPTEAKYAARFVLGRLRLGIGDPTILEALAHVEVSRALSMSLQGIPPQNLKKNEKIDFFNRIEKNMGLLAEVDKELGDEAGAGKTNSNSVDNKRASRYFQKILSLRQEARQSFERAYNICSDMGLTARTYKTDGIQAIRDFRIKVGFPVRMALCERASSTQDIIDKATDRDSRDEMHSKVGIEAKYDGIRCQVHKDGDDVNIFSRNLERMTHMFPDIAEATRTLPVKNIIFEGEALAYNEDTGELLPFQVTMQRRRKHNVSKMADEFPLKLFAFELLYLDGEDYTQNEYEKRHVKLDEVIGRSPQSAIETALRIKTSDPDKIDELFNNYIETGLEGIIAKRLDAPYIAGSRNYNWIKLKRSYQGELADSLDVCIIGFFRGKGARTKFGIGALLGAAYDQKADMFRSISKIGTGFTEKQLKEYFRLLDGIKLDEKPANVDSDIIPDVWVEPRYVLTVTADEITRSPNHTAGRDQSGMGYALRFPRAEGMPRADKSATDANTVDEIIRLSEIQTNIKAR